MKRTSQMKGAFWLVISTCIALSIFNFSSQTSTESGSLSLKLAQIFLPFLEIDTAHFLIRKMAHFTIFASLGFSLYRSFSFFKGQKPSVFWFCLGFLILYAGLDEFHQLFVSGRSGEIRDVCIDSCGGLLGISLSFWLRKVF